MPNNGNRNDNDNGKESDVTNSIGNTHTRQLKEHAIEQMRASLLPPMPPLLDNLIASQLV